MKQKIDTECLNHGYPYCSLIKQIIDGVLEQNAKDRTNLGVNSTKEEVEAVKKKEIERLKEVEYLAPDFISRLLNED
jgi:hypothetical protein